MDRPSDIRLFLADGILDAEGVCAAPGALLLEYTGDSLCVLSSGKADAVIRSPGAERAARVDCPGSVLIPGLINAHTHLDLTHIGPQPYDPVRDRFGDWLGMILRERARSDDEVRASVRQGIERSLQGGIVAVGDIAGVWSTVATHELRDSVMTGVSYIECFGAGARQDESHRRLISLLDELEFIDRGVRVGVSPHAPYSVGRRLYEQLLQTSRSMEIPLATHLAESEPEREFIADGGGLFRGLLDSMGLWDDSILDEVGNGKTPISHFFEGLRDRVMGADPSRAPVTLVHCNDVCDEELDTLSQESVSIAYCPRSSQYFGADRHFGPHRYAEMIRLGINVALGTDSIVNLPRGEAGEAPLISTLDEIRFLYGRDGDSGGLVPPRQLLAMATTNAARALGLDTTRFTMAPGEIEGVVSVKIGTGVESEGLARALALSTGAPVLLAGPTV